MERTLPALVLLLISSSLCRGSDPDRVTDVATSTEVTHHQIVLLEYSYLPPLFSETMIQFIAVMGDDPLERRIFVGNRSIDEILTEYSQSELQILKSFPELFLQALQTEYSVIWHMNTDSSYLQVVVPIAIGPKKLQASFKLTEKARNMDETVSMLLDKVTQLNAKVY